MRLVGIRGTLSQILRIYMSAMAAYVFRSGNQQELGKDVGPEQIPSGCKISIPALSATEKAPFAVNMHFVSFSAESDGISAANVTPEL
jgi:hypothetical protein